MWGNFGLFCSFSGNHLASTLDYIVMWMIKTNPEKAYCSQHVQMQKRLSKRTFLAAVIRELQQL